jgi:hypothetical protein
MILTELVVSFATTSRCKMITTLREREREFKNIGEEAD